MTRAMTPLHRTARRSNYDKFPVTDTGRAGAAATGWGDVAARLRAGQPKVVVVDCYPGVSDVDIKALTTALVPDDVVDVSTALKSTPDIDAMVAPDLGDDPVFGRLTSLRLADFFDEQRLAQLRQRVADASGRRLLVMGVGAALVARGDVLLHASMPRREIELRQNRGEIGNLGADNIGTRPSLLYKRAYFVDWRVADEHKQWLWPSLDFVLDTTGPHAPV